MNKLALLVALSLAAACNDGRRGSNGDGGHKSGDGFTSGDGGDGCATTCSDDLRSVVDCNGTVLSTCPADQACAAGGCEEACQAAKDDHSAIGCEYYAVDPPVFTQSCFAAYVANTWSTPVSITVDYDGATLDVTQFAYVPNGSGPALTYSPLSNGMLPAGSIAILFLSSTAADCPTGLGVARTDGNIMGTGLGKAFHITTSEPVIAYDIFPYGGGSSAVASATLLLPVSVWDTNYVGITAYPQTVSVGEDLEANPWISIVAMEDDTQVTISPTVNIAGSATVNAATANTPATYMLSKGQTLNLDQMDDLSGSPIVSTKPIGVWGGNGCTDLPASATACDGMHQQIPPVKALGHEYAAVRYRNRVSGMEETPPWRIMGVVDGTTLTYDPAPPVGSPTTLGKGQVIEFEGSGPFDIKSQDAMHPFYFGAHMTGCSVIGGNGGDSSCTGDPEFVNVVPQEQYLSSYIFFTDPTYPETNLVFVRGKNASGQFDDVTLDCFGTLTGWMPVDSGDSYEYTRVDLSTGNFQAVGMCDNGRHEAHSTTRFGLTIWGWGSNQSSPDSEAVSYAYPAGASVRAINPVVVPIQ